jgi:hypothetical protein
MKSYLLNCLINVALRILGGAHAPHAPSKSATATWWRLFQKRVVRTKFYIYICITISSY